MMNTTFEATDTYGDRGMVYHMGSHVYVNILEAHNDNELELSLTPKGAKRFAKAVRKAAKAAKAVTDNA